MTSEINNNKSLLNIYSIIDGIGAASGLIYENGKLFLISDHSDVLYIYSFESEEVNKISLFESGKILENRPKHEKSDYESITQDERFFYIFGSGSTTIRKQMVVVSKESYSVSVHSLNDFYTELQTVSFIDDDNLNIEGAIINKNSLLLFNRGNGLKKQNGVFKISHWKIPEKRNIKYLPIPLPSIEDTVFGFTDAVLIQDKIYFLATAEAVASTYEDGEILGSLIGRMDLKDLKIEDTQIITREHKLEGITLYKKEGNRFHFLVCEDPDDGQMMSEVFELKINR